MEGGERRGVTQCRVRYRVEMIKQWIKNAVARRMRQQRPGEARERKGEGGERSSRLRMPDCKICSRWASHSALMSRRGG